MQRCQDWISPLRVHRRMSMSSGLDRILRRVVMCIDCIGRLFSLCDRRDDKVGEDTLLIQHVPLDDGANIIEHGDVVVRVKRSFKDSVRTTCDSDIYRSSISRYFYLRWDVASEDVVRRSVIDFQHDLFVFKDNRLCLYKKRPNRSAAPSSRAEVEDCLSSLFSLWLAPSFLLRLFLYGSWLRLLHLLHRSPLWGFSSRKRCMSQR